ncbi:hypothetical protein SLEP1_g6296 [Rubroshorea leprosula]|uniref:Uncharacterized protein n=1 Tax=Rubroshorea leprosula TaxID=152421 RepID=A0AAV5HUQ9_9ROSI|nr:hypothetical protein SLEP1_g6296 [Rubroshorea leprosula]
MNPSSKQQNWLHRNPALLGSGMNPAYWVSSEPSKGDPARLGSTRPRSAGFEPGWVSLVGFRRDPAGWVPTRPSKLGSSQPSKVETQGRKERKRKKEGEEEGLGG